MKVFVKTLKGTRFEIDVKIEDTVAELKKNIETVQGTDVYPAERQMLIHQGKVLKDATTLEDNDVAENSFIVIMLSKSKSSTAAATSTASTAPMAPQPSSAPTATPVAAPPQVPATVIPPASIQPSDPAPANVYGQAASNLVAGTNMESTTQQLLDMGGGSWDRDTVTRALRAAFNNPERAVEYLYSGIPEVAELPSVEGVLPVPALNSPAQFLPATQPVAAPSSGPNASPLNLFPQGLRDMGANSGAGGNLDFLRNNQQFQDFRSMVQANPQILQPLLQELGRRNPQLVRLIQEHQADFLRLINEPVEGRENVPGQVGQMASGLPSTVTVTAAEREAIGRLEAMGFERSLVLEVFFACNKNEELAANYLLDHIHEFEE